MTAGPWGPRDAPPEASPAAPPGDIMRPADVRLNRTDFLAAIAANKRNTEILCAVLTLIGVVVGGAIGWSGTISPRRPGSGWARPVSCWCSACYGR